MYHIHTLENHLLVEFKADFSYNFIEVILHHESRLPEYTSMDDIWWIGKHRALVTLGELEMMIADFRCMCPRNATRKKTAIVVDQGLTESIVRLWAKGVNKQLPFECRVFNMLDEAEAWLGVSADKVA